jgi:hypothetical protein
MTLAMAWVRTAGDAEELIFASDSRLRFGCAWDSCQKVFPLPRGDCAVAFAGDTHFAYPFVHAAVNAIALHRKASRRQNDITELVPVLLRAINAMLAEISDLAVGQVAFDEPDLRLLFGGFSWRDLQFKIWKFHFNPSERAFRQVEVREWRGFGTGRRILIIGNPEASRSALRRAGRQNVSPPTSEEDVQKAARDRLRALLESKGERDGFGLDMEPLEVLRDMVREGVSPHVGGPPQMLKVYRHLNNQPFGVRWPDVNGRVAVFGRLSPPGEALHVPVLDPESLKVIRTARDVTE